MSERAVQPLCRDCGRPVADHDGHALRCSGCFDDFLRERDFDFLSEYAGIGVSQRRTVAETCFRALVMDNPSHRKQLAMQILDEYAATARDLVRLYHALRERERSSVMRTMLEFEPDRASMAAFFQEIATTPGPELLDRLGLPQPDAVASRCPSLSTSDAKDLARALNQLAFDLAYASNVGETAALALAQFAGDKSRRALVQQSRWLDAVGLRPHQVASLSVDAKRRTVHVNAVSVDEKKLEGVIAHINAITRAAENMIYGVLSLHQEDARRTDGANSPRRKRRA
jgi:hypothetical protein